MRDFVQPQPASISPPIGEAIERNEEACAPQQLAERPFPQWLANPWVDKILAILAVLPFVYPIAMHFRHHLKFGEIVYLAQVLLLIGTMVIRRLPVRISTNPYFWVVAFMASYWGLLILSVEQPGRLLVAPRILLPLYFLGVFMDVLGTIEPGKKHRHVASSTQDRGSRRLSMGAPSDLYRDFSSPHRGGVVLVLPAESFSLLVGGLLVRCQDSCRRGVPANGSDVFGLYEACSLALVPRPDLEAPKYQLQTLCGKYGRTQRHIRSNPAGRRHPGLGRLASCLPVWLFRACRMGRMSPM